MNPRAIEKFARAMSSASPSEEGRMKWAELAEQAKERADKDYRLLTYLVWFLLVSAGAMVAIAVVLVIFG